MKTELTKDELNTLVYSLSETISNLKEYQRRDHQRCGEEFDEAYEALIKKIGGLQERLYGALTLLEDQER